MTPTSTSTATLTAEREARIGLATVCDPTDPGIADLVARYGATYTWNRALTSTVEPEWAHVTERARAADPAVTLAQSLEPGAARILIPGDTEWPTSLDTLDHPPFCLWVRGPANLADATRRSVTITGSRMATITGQSIASEFAHDLAAKGFTITTGGGYGIDAAATTGALETGGTTITVLACGVNRLYPAGTADLMERAALTGVIVSEYRPGTSPMRARFLRRNQLLAALTGATLIVEAGCRSGSLGIARRAHDQGRPLGAVPGGIHATNSVGTNDLIKHGLASLVTSPADLIDLIESPRA